MSFDSHSELHPNLLALTQMTQWHSDSHQLPLELRFTVHGGTVDSVRTAVTGAPEAQIPADFTQTVTVAVFDLARTENLSDSFTVRINASPGGQAIVKQRPLTTHDTPADSADSQPSQTIFADGLQLRTALLERGHTSGYSPEEIAAEERDRGFSFSPELKFYRALVREGVVTQIDGQDVLASRLGADFGASSLDSAPWKAPETNTGAVQAVLNHRLWIEIAHSDTHLYALDLAPGPAGSHGQIIARRIGEASVPVQVAHSLAQFVAGDAMASPESDSSTENTPDETPQGQTVAWVGTVDPIAFPALLGWADIPSEERYREVVQGLEGAPAHDEGEPSPQDPTEQPSDPVAETTAAETSAPEDATALFSGDSSSDDTADTPEPDSEAPQEEPVEPTSPEAAQDENSEPDAENSDEDIDPGIAYAPISPEQKNIATAIGTLAFGTKEQREEYRATDTSPIPTLDARGKKLSLTSASPGEVAAQREGKRPEGHLRSALRKFFTGS